VCLGLWAVAQYAIFMIQVLGLMLPSTGGCVVAALFHFVVGMMCSSLYCTIRTDPGVVPWDTRCHGHYRVGSPLNLPVTSKGDNLASPEVHHVCPLIPSPVSPCHPSAADTQAPRPCPTLPQMVHSICRRNKSSTPKRDPRRHTAANAIRLGRSVPITAARATVASRRWTTIATGLASASASTTASLSSSPLPTAPLSWQ